MIAERCWVDFRLPRMVCCKLDQGIEAEVGQRMALEPGPEALDRIRFGAYG